MRMCPCLRRDCRLCLHAYICSWLYTCTPQCVSRVRVPACLHAVHISFLYVCFWVSVCVSEAWVVSHSDCKPRPLAGKTVGLAGLSRALKLLYCSAQLHWWLQASCHFTLKRYSRELVSGRPPAKNRTMSSCLVGSHVSSTIGSEPSCWEKPGHLCQFICTVFVRCISPAGLAG